MTQLSDAVLRVSAPRQKGTCCDNYSRFEVCDTCVTRRDSRLWRESAAVAYSLVARWLTGPLLLCWEVRHKLRQARRATSEAELYNLCKRNWWQSGSPFWVGGRVGLQLLFPRRRRIASSVTAPAAAWSLARGKLSHHNVFLHSTSAAAADGRRAQGALRAAGED